MRLLGDTSVVGITSRDNKTTRKQSAAASSNRWNLIKITHFVFYLVTGPLVVDKSTTFFLSIKGIHQGHPRTGYPSALIGYVM